VAKREDHRKQARLLLRAARDGESEALTRVRAAPRLADLFDDDLVYAVRLADARHAIALENGFASGKVRLDLQLTDAARSLGLSSTDLGRQVRSAFFGVST
jgi:hypothetical protein